MTDFPETLKMRLAQGHAIPFIGAGVSMAVRKQFDGSPLFPSWKSLLLQAAARLIDEKKDNKAALVRIFTEENRFLEAAKEAKDGLGANWFSFLKEQFDRDHNDASPDSLELARKAWALGSNLVITTNYDKVLRWACPNVADLAEWDIEAPAEQCNLLRSGASKPIVWHLHGKIDNAAEIILTPEGYQRLYPSKDNESRYQAALETLRSQLASRSFLFIGFSLADEDFVDQLKEVDDIFQGASGPHYVLLPESQRGIFKPPANNIEPVFFSDFGPPQLQLLDEFAGCVKTVTSKTAIATGEVGDFSPSKAAFNVPFHSKGDQLVGRQDALEQVRRQLQNGKRTAIGQTASFQGLGGLGKTQLAVEYAHAHRGDYPNGVIWLNADQDIIPQLIRLAEDSHWVATVSDQAFKVSMAIKRLREYSDCLIIFDNLESQDAILEFLPAPSAHPHILVTSRLDQPGFTPIPLSTLSPELGLRLLLQEAGREPDSEAERLAAKSIVERLDGLPLALELAGAFLRRRSSMGWRDYAELLREDLQAAFPAFLQRESFTRHEADLYSTLKIHAALFDEEPLLEPVLDVLTWSGPAAMSVSLLCHMLDLEKPTALSGALALGHELRILQQSADHDRYAIHRLVREVRRAEIPLETRRDWAELCGKRLGEWFEARREDFHHLPIFEANLDHLLAWRQNAVSFDFYLQATRLTWLEAYPAYHWGRYQEVKQGVEKAWLLYEKSPDEDAALKAHLLNDSGTAAARLGNFELALNLNKQALAIRIDLYGENHSDTATSLSNVAICCLNKGDRESALRFGEQALAIQRRLFGEEHPDTAHSLNNIAGYYNDKGDSESALKLGEQALAIRLRFFGEEHPDTANSLNSVASYCYRFGDIKRALTLREKAWGIYQNLLGSTHPKTVLCNHNIIKILARYNKHQEAFQRLEAQLKLITRDHPHYERLQETRNRLLKKTIRPGFRQPSSNPGKKKKRR